MHITIIILAGPHIASFKLGGLGDHIVNKSVLVPDASFFEIFLILGLVQLVEDVLEPTVIHFQDGVLGGHVERILLGEGILEAGVTKSLD